MTTIRTKKKLIEVSLPLDAINRESAREKNIHAGHPSTLHLYWARRPLATARSILFAQLVDDPSSNPERFPTVEQQERERLRLHALIEQLAKWENLNNSSLLEQAEFEIKKSNDGKLPIFLDPFAGGGSIPLEAKRLGMESHASDLNPLAVLLNKCLIEFPSMFPNQKPASVTHRPETFTGFEGVEGLVEDIRFYGKKLNEIAFEKLQHAYPKVRLSDGSKANVIAWIWARTVLSPNPANPIEVPLVHSWWLSKRKGKEAYVSPRIENGKVVYEIVFDKFGPDSDSDGTIGRRGGFAVGDRTPISLDYVRKEGRAGRMGSTLMAMVVETARGRTYVTPDAIQIAAADVAKPANLPEGELPRNPRDFKTPNYGLISWKDLFTARQLNSLSVFYESLDEVRESVCNDAVNGGLDLGEPLEENGAGALAYSEVVSVYLALAIGRTADYGNALCGWRSDIETIRNLFSRQAISMVWDYAESNPFSNSTGNFLGQVDWVAKAVANVPSGTQGKVDQFDASSRDYGNFAISTDPPYYDNIGYADLSDFFYVWLRRALLKTMPKLFGTMQTPKAEELVADPYRHGNKQEAEKFFIDGFNRVFDRIAQQSNLDIPITIYYAYKQQDVDSSGNASTGWHTLLDGLISANWEVTATWPVRTESKNRLIGNGRNVLASSIVLSCRVRSKSAETISKHRFVQVLREELPKALHDLMQGSIAPVDLAQAAIGPGIAVFSRYARVREADGSDMSVKDALLLINFTLDEVLNEQESDFDPDTRFAVKWYKQFGWTEGSSGLAEQLARSSDTSVGALERGGILEAKAGKAKLLAPVDLNTNWEPETDDRISIWECVVRLAGVMSREGAEIVAQLLPSIENRVGLDAIKELGFLLFHEAEKKGDTQDAIMFNGLVGAWGDLKEQARKQSDSNESGYQTPFYFEDQED